MKKGDKHYLIFTTDNKITPVNSLNNIHRLDINFVIERTYLKDSSGLHLFKYFENQILDSNLKIVEENTFSWGNIKCKLEKNEFYGTYQYYLAQPKINSSYFKVEVEDLLNQKCSIKFSSAIYDRNNNEYIFDSAEPFNALINDLNLLNKVGTCEALFEIKKLEDKILKLQLKLKKLSKK